MSAKITVKRSQVTDRLFSKVIRLKEVVGFANRVLYKEYRKLQIERWESANTSQGAQWTRLRPTYRKRKLRIYAGYPYGGRKIGVATGRLLKSVVGPSPEHRKMVTSRGFKVFSAVPYAAEFDESRTITEFNDETRERIAAMVRGYLS